MIGTRLAHYEITSHLGTGGMGEVYQATDSKLGRSVAIKLLPEAFAHDHDRAARFEREARVLASLNHPNIAAIYGIEESGGRKFLVMELVGGETLAERIKRGAVHIDQALGIAKEIAEALEAAHEKGIIHRDLKPANIKVTANGKVKVLDFGLAKAFVAETASTSLSNSPTMSMAATMHGMILGTAAYMAPEQAKGLEVDARTDIFAFGAVVYEMLTGRQAFGGEDLPDILSKVLRRDPDWTLLPAGLPSSLRRVLTRCLQKDPDRRTRDIADARMDLEEAEAAAPIAPPAGTKARRLSARYRIAVLGVCLALAVGFGLWMGRLWERRSQPAAIEWRGDLLGGSTIASAPRISPDGQMLAFRAMVDGQTQVAVMTPQSGNWTVLSHDKTKGLVGEISWSHDGTRIFFSRSAEVPYGIFSIPSVGGEERLILEDADNPQALPDGSLLVARLNAQRILQLFHFWPETGRLEALDALLGESVGGTVRVFQDGSEAVFRGETSAAPGQRGLFAISLATGRSRRLAPGLPVADVTAIATTPGGQWVLFNIPSGNVDRIVEVPRDGSRVVRPVLTLAHPGTLDVGPDGSIYVDHETRTSEAFSYSPLNGKVERLTLPETTVTVQEGRMILPLPDGRMLFGTVVSGRRQLAVLAPGKNAVPFLETGEETSSPAALVGKDRAAFLIGTPPNQRIAIASLSDGRIVGRLEKPNSGNVRALAGSPDGNSLYYVEGGFVWATTSGGGEPRKVHEGDRVAVDPSDHSLIIEVTTKDGVRLVRVPPSGGAEQPISIPNGLRLIADLSSGAVAPDGRIAVRYAPKDNWFWPTAILDPRSGKLTELPGVRDLDMNHASWASDGRLVSVALPERSALWRFRPVSSGK